MKQETCSPKPRRRGWLMRDCPSGRLLRRLVSRQIHSNLPPGGLRCHWDFGTSRTPFTCVGVPSYRAVPSGGANKAIENSGGLVMSRSGQARQSRLTASYDSPKPERKQKSQNAKMEGGKKENQNILRVFFPYCRILPSG